VLKVAEPLRGFLGAGHALVAPGILVLTVALSVVSWFFECLAFYLILQGFGVTMPLRVATVVYAFASLAGAVSMLPRGLGVAGRLAGCGGPRGTGLRVGAAATLLVRAAPLWLAVGLGVAPLALAFHGEPEDAPTRVG